MTLPRYLALASLLAPASVAALGVGDIRLHSSLNQILSAEIPLVFSGQDSLSTLHVTLASVDDFAKTGIPRPNHLAQLQFKPVPAPGGQFAIQVSSRDVINEPCLDFLLEIESPQGRVLREFTLLLDPPAGLTQRREIVQPPPEPAYFPVVQPVIQSPPARNGAVADPNHLSPPLPQQLAGQTYGPVERGERLLRIAETLEKPDSISTVRMAAGLYAANPLAFRKNARGLLAGSTLNIPNETYLGQISEQQARTTLKTPVRALLSDEIPSELPADSTSEIGQNLQSPSGAMPSPALSTRTTALLKKDNETLQLRVEQLEQKLADAQRMLDLKDAELATIHSHQQTSISTEHTQTEPATGRPEVTLPGIEPPPTPASTTLPNSVVTASPAIQAPAPASPKPASPPHALTTVDDSSLLSEWGNWLLAGALGLLGIGTWLRRRRSFTQPDTEPEWTATPEATAPTSTTQVSPSVVPTPEKAIGDTHPLAPHPLTETTALDPIAEADVYLGYDRYSQAETLIRAAIKVYPEAHPLKAKLLEIFIRSHNHEAFDRYVDELKLNEALPSSFWNTVNTLRPEQTDAGQERDDGASDRLVTTDAAEPPTAGADAPASIEYSIDDDIKAFEAEYSGDATKITTDYPQKSVLTQRTEPPAAHLIEYTLNPEPARPERSEKPDSVELENLIAYPTKPEIQTNSLTELAELDLPEPSRKDIENAQATPFGALDFSLTLIDIPRPPDHAGEEVADAQCSTSSNETLKTQLDLAKRYLTLGDKPAAKLLLEQLVTCNAPDIRTEAESTLSRLGKVHLTLVPSLSSEDAYQQTGESGKSTAVR